MRVRERQNGGGHWLSCTAAALQLMLLLLLDAQREGWRVEGWRGVQAPLLASVVLALMPLVLLVLVLVLVLVLSLPWSDLAALSSTTACSH